MPAQRTLGRGWALLPAAALVCVACAQIVLARTAGLAPWSGGGFGMFASTDAGAMRHLHAFVQRPGVRRQVVVPRPYVELVRRARALPTDAHLRRIADVVVRTPTADHGPPVAVEIQVWQRRFDPETLRPSGVLLRGFEQDRAAGE